MGASDMMCAACGGAGSHAIEDASGGYCTVACAWCQGAGTMTQKMFRAWLDEESHKTPIDELDADEIARRFETDG